MDLNLTAYVLLAQAIGKRMIQNRAGSIINVGSINGSVAFPQRLAYCVSKAGVDMLTKVLAIEWASHGVRVNCLAPGYVDTPFIQGLASRGVLDTRKLAARTPLGRLGTPEEIGDVAVFLAGEESSFVTGAVITADGGWQAYGYL
jgi:NAD(P)-dependent dehydrogenase (short-subunit alcohol dehydrogenase family)